MAVIAAIQRQKLQPARKACGRQNSSLRATIRKTFLAVVDVTRSKKILEAQDMVKQFRGNLFKDPVSTVSIYGRMRCAIGTWVNEAAVIV